MHYISLENSLLCLKGNNYNSIIMIDAQRYNKIIHTTII